jgi:hypothetical protein
MKRDDDELEERPRRRKKKSKSQTPAMKYLLVASVIGTALVVVVVIVLAIVIVFRAGTAKTPTPQEYVGYDAPEDVFHVDFPKGWNIQHGGMKTIYWATAEKGSASIKVHESFIGSLLGDIANAGTPDLNVPDEELPVSKVHEMKRILMDDDYTNYREEPAVSVRTRFGLARRSEFTGREGLKKVRGYRVTTLAGQEQIRIVCTCSPSDWDNLEPAFNRVIESVGRGRSGK